MKFLHHDIVQILNSAHIHPKDQTTSNSKKGPKV